MVKKIFGVMMLIFSLGIIYVPQSSAQEGGVDEIMYKPVEFPDIGVSLEIPADWQAELSNGELGGLELDVPEISDEYNGVKYTIDPFTIELLFLPLDISGDSMAYAVDTASFSNALSLEFLLHTNDDVDIWNSFGTEFSDLNQLIPISITRANNSSSYEYFIPADNGIIWLRSKSGIFLGFGDSSSTVLEHMLDTLNVDWSLAKARNEITIEALFTYIGIEYVDKYDLQWNETTSFSVNINNERQPSETYTNLEWTSAPHHNQEYTSYNEALATVSSFDIELMVDEDISVVLEKLPLDIEVGIYQADYGINYATGGSYGSSAYVVIESVTEDGISGRFFLNMRDERFYYGRFVNVGIPHNDDCFAIGSPKDSSVKLSVDMIDDELAPYEYMNQNVYWFVERQANHSTDDQNQADMYLRFSPTFDGTGLNLTVTLRPARGATVGTYSNPIGNPRSVGEASVAVAINDRTFSSTSFAGDIGIDRFDDRVSGYIDGELIYYLTDDLYLTLGTIHTDFNNLIVPSFNCEITSVDATPAE